MLHKNVTLGTQTSTTTINIIRIIFLCQQNILYLGGINLENYQQLLSDLIHKSGKTLIEISKELQDLGFTTGRSYLGRLRNGKVPPASEELNIALAKVLNADPEQLLLASYLEKAPDTIKEIVHEYSAISNSVDFAIKNTLNMYESLEEIPEAALKYLYEINISPVDITDLIQKMQKQLTLFYKMEFFVILTSYNKIDVNVTDTNIDIVVDAKSNLDAKSIEIFTKKINTEYYKFQEEKFPIFPKYELPIFEKVFSNGVFYENDYLGTESNNNFADKIAFWVYSFDNGGKEIGIHKNDKVLVDCSIELRPYDPVIVSVNGFPGVIRQIQRFKDTFILRPFNKTMKLEIYPLNQVSIIGKVVEVEKRRHI